MHSSTTILLTSVLISVAAAQYTIDPNTVPLATRNLWCNSQVTECPLICLQYPGNSDATDSNTCNATSLSYSCICSNGIAPNATQYNQTLSYFVCTEWGSECVANCGSDNICASDCRSLHPCGAQNPVRVNTSTVTSTVSSTGVPGGASVGASGTVYTGFGGAAATSTVAGSSGGSGAAALELGQMYRSVAVAAGMFGGFALLL